LNFNDFTVAQRCWEEAWTLYRALDSPNDMTDIRLYLILLAIQMGDLSQAQMLCEEELPGCRERGDLFRTASALKRLAEVAQNRGDFTGARALIEESLPLFRQAGNPLLLAEALRVTGRLAMIQGDYATGRAHWEEELQIAARMGLRRQGWEHLFLSRTALFYDEPVTARHYPQEALTLARAEGQFIPMAQAFLLLRDLASRTGTTGGTLYSQQLQELAAAGHHMDIGWAYLVISDEAVFLGRDSIAISYLEEAQRYLAESEPVSHLAPLYLLQGGIAIRQGDYRKGRSCLTEYLRCCHETLESPYYRYWIGQALDYLAQIGTEEGQVEQAARLWGAVEVCHDANRRFNRPNERARYENAVTKARQALNAEVFAVAWAEGNAMTLDQAVAYGLEEL
jgi:tetratricopeptide (TPR) repeat protein